MRRVRVNGVEHRARIDPEVKTVVWPNGADFDPATRHDWPSYQERLAARAKGREQHILFDGAGTKWIVELSTPEHQARGLFESVKDRITGACSFCTGAFGVTEGIRSCGISLLGEYDGHPSFRKLVSQGY